MNEELKNLPALLHGDAGKKCTKSRKEQTVSLEIHGLGP